MDEPVLGRQDGHDRAEPERVHRRGAEGADRQGTGRMHEATVATPGMAAYFLVALRDQSSRAGAFQRQLRWQRLRHAIATEEAVVAEEHRSLTEWADPRPAAPIAVAALTTSEARPEPPREVAG